MRSAGMLLICWLASAGCGARRVELYLEARDVEQAPWKPYSRSALHRVDEDVERLRRNFWSFYGISGEVIVLRELARDAWVPIEARYEVRAGDASVTVWTEGGELRHEVTGAESFVISKLGACCSVVLMASGDVTVRASAPGYQPAESTWTRDGDFRGAVVAIMRKE